MSTFSGIYDHTRVDIPITGNPAEQPLFSLLRDTLVSVVFKRNDTNMEDRPLEGKGVWWENASSTRNYVGSTVIPLKDANFNRGYFQSFGICKNGLMSPVNSFAPGLAIAGLRLPPKAPTKLSISWKLT